jgi:hypothetical protein
MIEFRAECGHTVRARDEDAGKAVRCSYCGASANVPAAEEGTEFDRLLADLGSEEESPAAAGGEGGKRRPRRTPRRSPRTTAPRSFNPFALVIKLCWGAAVLIVLIFLARMVVIPMFKGEERKPIRETRTADQGAKRDRKPKQDSGQGQASATRHRSFGLLDLKGTQGLYVESVPAQAQVYWAPMDRAPIGKPLFESGLGSPVPAGQAIPRVNKGEYLVEVVFPWNDARLTGYPDYVGFRRNLEEASSDRRTRLMQEYFLPDGADRLIVYQTPGQIYLIRQYRNVTVREGRWTAVRAVFLPRLVTVGPKERFDIERIVRSFVPDRERYQFDESHVQNELTYYQVTEGDRFFYIEALKRMGIVACITPDGKLRVFTIGVDDGTFAARTLERRP